ncbi:MAG: hypothetical protein IK095_04805 [Oscillospiraceae bacterium]|nr:hypothetical protein [Oscillospiraceae bacterium]
MRRYAAELLPADVVLRPAWERDEPSGQIRRLPEGAVQVCIDLKALRGRLFAGAREQIASLWLTVRAMGERLRLLEQARCREPESYLEGLAMLDDLARWEREGRLCVCVPRLDKERAPLSGPRGPGDLLAALRALEDMLDQLGDDAPGTAPALLDELRLWSAVPELSWQEELPGLLRQIATAAAQELLERGCTAPAATCLAGADGALCSLRELSERGRDGQRPFQTGLALRWLCLLALRGEGEADLVPVASARGLERDVCALLTWAQGRTGPRCRDMLLALSELARGLQRLPGRERLTGDDGGVWPLGMQTFPQAERARDRALRPGAGKKTK